MRNSILTIGYSTNPKETKRALSNKCDVVFTYNLDDMTDPTRTIYCITGAGYVYGKTEGIKHGYLNRLGQPLETSKNKYPIAINSSIYIENFRKRLRYLDVYTKSAFGIHVGGSNNMVEHCFPKSHMTSSGLWSHGFKDTHYLEKDISMIQFQVDVWEEITNEMIQEIETVFKSLSLITTAFRCPTKIITKRSSSMMSNGEEVWYMLKRMSLIHRNWKNIFFNLFEKESSVTAMTDKFVDIKSHISAYNLRSNIIASYLGVDEMIGRGKRKRIMPDDTKEAGTPYHAYMMDCHGGMIVDLRSKVEDKEIANKIIKIKRLPV